MKLSYQWLKDYVAIKLSPEELAHKLTMAGSEVKGIEKISGDAVFEIEVTPNRPDCLSVVGLAREVSAILNTPLKLPSARKWQFPKSKCDISIQDKTGCLRYMGIVIQDVQVKSSSVEIEKRLSSIGSRPINNIVDITNFCLMETGQPLHAFDFDKLVGGKIIVRRAKEGESIMTIDGVERKLNPSILVIADEKRPVAIAGIMGGKETEVTELTKNILLESAYFDPILIRRGARMLGLSSDSSYRFERGVDMEGVRGGAERAVSLILQHAKGKVSAFSDPFLKKLKGNKWIIKIKQEEIQRLLGVDLPLARLKTILGKLGFKVVFQKNALNVTAPSFRSDIKEPVDLIEEIARIVGYDVFPTSLPEIKASIIPDDKNRITREKLSNALCSLGLNEMISYAMMPRKALEKCRLSSDNILRVKNPLTAEQEIMRPSLLPGMLNIVAINLNRGQKDLCFFETGKVYPLNGSEREHLGIIIAGQRHHDWRRPAKEEVEFYDIKGMVEKALKTLNISRVTFSSLDISFFEPTQSVAIKINGTHLGFVGCLSKEVLAQWDIKYKNVYFAELNLETVYKNISPLSKYQPIAEFPVIVRDVSLAVKNAVTYDEICNLAYQQAFQLLKDIKFVEQYIGDKIPSGYRGLTISLIYQSSQRTLREDEVNQIHDQFCKTVVERLGAIKR